MITHARRVAGLAVAASIVVAAASATPAVAATVRPTPSSALVGTWVNDGPVGPISLTKLVITADGPSGLRVDSFGTCNQPTVCEYGSIPAAVFGAAADSNVGQFFKTNQAFAAYNKILLGQYSATSSGPRITLQRFEAWKDNSRFNSVHVYGFKRVSTSTAGATKVGNATTAYPTGKQPTPTNTFLGTWHNANAHTVGLAQVIISRAGNGPLMVHAFGKCTPTACDIGTFPAVVYGASSLSGTGGRFIAPHNAGFKNEVYVGQIAGNTLNISYYNQYTDGSGRASFVITEAFVQ